MLDLSLLPAEDESVRCADFTRDLRVDPGGSAIRADRLIAVETPLPWPKPVFAHDLLGDVPDLVARADVPTRVLAAVPETADGMLAVVAYERSPGSAVRRAWRCEHATLPATVAAVETDGITTVRLEAGEAPGRVWHARVRVGREIPTITCRVPGGLPTKLAVEYEVIDVVAR